MSARHETIALANAIERRTGVMPSFDHANTLRRAQLTLHRWAELECGDGNDHCSWSIERDDETGIPYFVTYPHTGESRRWRIADKEAGALRRVSAVCASLGLHYYHQTDPRGCALYVSREPIRDNDYTRGIACAV